MTTRRTALVAALAAALVGGAAQAQTELVPAFEPAARLGAGAARGAAIWNHGLAAVTEAPRSVPPVMQHFRAGGWDVLRLQRRWATDNYIDSSQALAQAARRLKAEGYARVVAVGQSFGAWLSFAAAAQTKCLVDAIVALAPAAYGSRASSPAWTLNADNLYSLAALLNPTRVMTFLFENDAFDPGGRGPRLRDVLAAQRLPHVVVDRPAGLDGHGAGLSDEFARQYGPEIVKFAEAPAPPDFACERRANGAAALEFLLPDALRIVPVPPNAPPGLAAFHGRWHGRYAENGREVMLVVTQVGLDRARAVYAWRERPGRPDEQPGYQFRRGEYDPAAATLRFAEPRFATLLYRLRGDGRLDARWAPADGAPGQELSAVLERLE